MAPESKMNKQALLEQYRQILARGCMSPDQRESFEAGSRVPGIVVQHSGGSGGAKPLRIPRTRAEIGWLGDQLIAHHARAHGAPPARAAFLGGVSHLEATERVEHRDGLEIRNFEDGEFQALDRFAPDLLSTYPSYARELAADRSLQLGSLKTLKLGGERILPSDLLKIFGRFAGITVLEQYGSTEMPAVAWRVYTRTSDSGYQLNTGRYRLCLAETPDWQPLIVRDVFPGRAFPIEEWFEMDDEVRLHGGAIQEVRRRGDLAWPLRFDLDTLLGIGCVQVQVLLHERIARVDPRSDWVPSQIELAGKRYQVRREWPLRLRDSNKLPLVVDTKALAASRFYMPRRSDPGATMR
jgi:hypothetical protein